jgi:hypothetical protein
VSTDVNNQVAARVTEVNALRSELGSGNRPKNPLTLGPVKRV